MGDLFKATMIAAVLCAGLLLTPIILTIMGVVISFGCLVLCIWFGLQVLKEEGDHDPDDPGP